MGLIETGVDRLLSLINEREKVLVKDAAKELAVSEQIVNEWAEFLEEEGYVTFEYKFSKTYITKKELSSENLKDKEKEYSSQKEAFVRKAETMLQLVDRDSLGLEDVKMEFDSIYKAVNEKKELIKDDLNTLQKYEDSKERLDQKLIDQKNKFESMLVDAEKKIKSKSVDVAELIDKIKVEESKISDSEKDIDELKTSEDKIKDQINDMISLAQNVNKRIDSREHELTHSKKTLKNLKSYADNIESQLKKHTRKVIDPLLKKVRDHEDDIKSSQDKLIKKITIQKDELKSIVEDTTVIEKQFEDLFRSKMKAHTIVSSLSIDKVAMEKELNLLIKKVSALTVFSKGKSINQKVSSIKKLFDDIELREESFKNKIKNLSILLYGLKGKK